jgi:two-component system, OmpR family, alkaline phosphatase synthesis response regulator PhoP
MDDEKKSILVVEDEIMLRKALVDKLIQKGYKVLQAGNGLEGLGLALRHKPNLILLDIMMPTMDGIEMLRKLRDNAWGKHAPVILLTNLPADDPITASVTELEPAYYMMKSNINLEQIMERIKSLL